MFKIFKRVLAYVIDMMIVLIVVQAISGIPAINKELDKYSKAYNDYSMELKSYSNFRMDLNNYYDNKKLSEKEYNKIIEDNPEYKDLLDKYYVDGKLTSKNYDKLVNELDDTYLEGYEKSYYNIDKYSRFFNGCYVVVIILYFVVFNIITDGVTLGKKLLGLKIVNSKDENEKISAGSYLIRGILLYQVLYYLVKVLFVNQLGVSEFYTLSNIVYDIYFYLMFIILALVIVRADGRGVHDILANTKVIEVNKKRDLNT